MSSKNPSNQDDDRYETEEYLVYVDLDTKLLDDQLSKSNAKIKFLGIDTESPIMQLNNQLFKGSYDYSMGTNCFFTESKRPGGVEDACFQELPKKLYDFYAKTNKVLKMKRIFVEEKETSAEPDLAEGEIEDLAHLHITKTYEEALNQFLKPGEKPPREIVHSYESSEEPQNDEPSEDSETTRAKVEAKVEAIVHEEFERLTDPDHESHQPS